VAGHDLLARRLGRPDHRVHLRAIVGGEMLAHLPALRHDDVPEETGVEEVHQTARIVEHLRSRLDGQDADRLANLLRRPGYRQYRYPVQVTQLSRSMLAL